MSCSAVNNDSQINYYANPLASGSSGYQSNYSGSIVDMPTSAFGQYVNGIKYNYFGNNNYGLFDGGYNGMYSYTGHFGTYSSGLSQQQNQKNEENAYHRLNMFPDDGNLNEEQIKINENNAKIHQYVVIESKEYKKTAQDTNDLLTFLANNEEESAEKIIREYAKDPHKMAAVQILAKERGYDLRKLVAKEFGIKGLQWAYDLVGAKTSKASEMLALLDEGAKVSPEVAAMALKNATDGIGCYNDVIQRITNFAEFTQDFKDATRTTYTRMYAGSIAGDLSAEWFNQTAKTASEKMSQTI